MKTRFLPMFVVVAALALLAGFPQSGGAVPQSQEPEPPAIKMQEEFCPPGEPCSQEASKAPWKQSPDGRWFMPAGARPSQHATVATPQSTGGPDDFGYTWDDSVALSWVDATAGTDTGMSGDGSQAVGVSLPFSFKYYENTYNSVYIVGAGYLGFSPASWDDQENIPSPERPNNVIAPYWTLTYLNSTGPSARVYYRSGGSAPDRYFVVEWYDVKGGPPSDTVGNNETYRFEVILHENGDIVFQYQAMTYDSADYYWCGAAGIEDSTGLDGLNYVSFCARAPSNKAVRFTRPAPSARVSVYPLDQGHFVHAGEVITFQVPIRNTGDAWPDDTYDLSPTSAWSMDLYGPDGITPLTDTNDNGMVDTGLVPQGSTFLVTARIAAPRDATLNDANAASIIVYSSRDVGKHKVATLQTVVPAFFAQVLQDNADGAMSLFLAQPGVQTLKKNHAQSILWLLPGRGRDA